MPSAALAAAYALHMTATAVWIGGLVSLGFLAAPVFHRLPAEERSKARVSSSRRFIPLAWLCLAVFIGTGLTQMSANPAYAGLLAIDGPWSAAILAKHLVVALMAAALGFQTWVLHPRLERAALGLMPSDPGSSERWRRLDLHLVQLSAALGIVVLALTAVARASN
jgi:putative copper export protein